MTREQAAQAFPGAQPDERTREVRNLPGRDMHGGGRAKMRGSDEAN